MKEVLSNDAKMKRCYCCFKWYTAVSTWFGIVLGGCL